MAKLTINLKAEDKTILGRFYPGYNLDLKIDDTSEWTSTDWFDLFEKILLYLGYAEKSIMASGLELAFNERRTTKSMREIYAEADLDEFATKTA